MPADHSHVTVAIVEPYDRRHGLVRQPNEFVRMVPYAFSWPRMVLFCVLAVLSLGTLFALSIWFPQVFTHIARQRLPHSSLGRAHYVLILVHDDGLRSVWVEVMIHQPPVPRNPRRYRVLWSSFWNACKRTCRHSSNNKQDSVAAADKQTAAVVKPDIANKAAFVWFEFKKHRYDYDANKVAFERYVARANEDLVAVRDRINKGLCDIASRTELFGPNVVDVDEPCVLLLLFAKVVHPFYLFQVFSVAVWFVEDYVVYAGVILGLSVLSLMYETYCEVANTRRLRKLVHSDHCVSVIRDGKTDDVHERNLVPGDIAIVQAGAVCADMLLLTGMCEADEASITGEALPVMKTPATGSGRTTDPNKVSMLFAGSTITRVRNDQRETDGRTDCVAVVLSTGFATGKGELLRSILYPRPLTFEFERDSYRYLAVLVAVALAAFIKRVIDASDVHTTFGDTVLHSLDLVTIAVPPALPLVLSSGVSFALARLKIRGVACLDARRINSCGQLTCFCFDKTGTLTGEHFQLAGAEMVSVNGASFESVTLTKRTDAETLGAGIADLKAKDQTKRVNTDLPSADTAGREPMDQTKHALPPQLRVAMATCHELSESGQGLMLDKEMFGNTECALTLTPNTTTLRVTSTRDDDATEFPGYDILARFPFDATKKRASVVVRDVVTSERFVFVKGSVDAIIALATGCPDDLADVARWHAAKGHYCIAFASKRVVESETDALDLTCRDAVECAVRFVGLAYFTNALKPESLGVIADLYAADIDVRMITGDDAYTALQVARDLAMQLKPRTAVVDVNVTTGDVQLWDAEAAAGKTAATWEHFTGASISRLLHTFDVVLTGAALDALRLECATETIEYVLRNTRLFARMQPQHKTWIVEQLMDMGETVGMCGDGTNDCGALKAAHVGLALLSGVDASLVAPFTSTRKSVRDVPMLIREGRCAIVTSFLAFKFMVLYPIIQLAMAATLAHVDLVLTNNQYVWDDLAIVLGLAITMLATGAAPTLARQQPPRTLFAPTVACSIVGHVAIALAFFAGHFALLYDQPTSWFCRISDAMAYLSGDTDAPASCGVYRLYNTPANEYSFEGTTVWLFGHMLFISVAAAMNVPDAFRMPSYRNVPFTALLLAVAGVNLWFLLDTSGVINDTFQLMALPFAFRWKLLTMFLGHLGAAVIWELVVTRVLPRLARRSE